MNVVLDTNIYISALVFPGGVCDQVIRLARLGKIHLHVSPDILTEFKNVLVRKFMFSVKDAAEACERIVAIATLVYPRFRIDVIAAPAPDADNRILECAIEAQADYLVTGDKKHLLPLKRYEDVKIVSPAQFLDTFDRVAP